MSRKLVELFRAIRPHDGPLDEDALDAALSAAYADGSAAWPALTVDAPTFVTALARRDVTASSEDIAGRCAPDLYLAIACEGGDPLAITSLEQSCFGEIEHAARRTGATPAQADEIRGELRRLLFVTEATRPAGVRGYSGRGPLRAYVRVSATRALVRVVSRGRRECSLEEAVLDDLQPGTDPVVAYLRDRYREPVTLAITDACRALDRDDRVLLRYALVERWSIDQLAALYAIHRTSAWRRVVAARDRLGERVRANVADRLAIPADEVDSIVRMVQSRVELSLERVLVVTDEQK